MSRGGRGNDRRGSRLWGIVLAGGEGTRLADLTRAVHGCEMPKQFATLGRERSFLQETIDRIAPIVPLEQTIVVVSESHADVAIRQLVGYPGVRLVVQPKNKGTTCGLLLPLAHVPGPRREAMVAIFPCDHRFRREAVFLKAVERAVADARRARGGMTLLGAVPDSPAADLGWIVPGRTRGPGTGGGGCVVRRFVEKPPGELSGALLREGGLWNTLVIAARVDSLWRVAHRHVPVVARGFARYRKVAGTARAPELLRALYDEIPTSDLSREILQVARGLRVVSMSDSGWCDCGTPERLFQTLEPAEREQLRRALQEGHRRAIAPRTERGFAIRG